MVTDYQIECDLWTPEREIQDHMDHEFNSRHDRWDGWGDPEARNEPFPDEMITVPPRPLVTFVYQDTGDLPF